VASEAGDIAAAELHIDGVLHVDEPACTFCHGDPTDPNEATEAAPPLDTEGNDASSAPGVGAHREHLASSDWRASLRCEDCHAVPSVVVADGHIDAERPADLGWGALATAVAAAPEYDGASCSGVYCHGATMPEGAGNTTPVWTTVDGSQAVCGSCHGLPPSSSWHPFVRDASTCGPCHPYTGQLPDAPATHIDGFIDWVEPLACHFCHGSDETPAPPTDLAGESDTSRTGVGAHRAHVLETASTNATGCAECHIEPGYWIAMGHRDGALPAEVVFGTIAQTGGRLPVWNGASCVDSYCHNPNPLDTSASKVTEPQWTLVDGSQAACAGCHGYPPTTATHPLDAACGNCHALVVGPDHVTIVNRSLHVNGLPEEN
jgi:predicted CxxxxCH...CXXCH cytochrome family protein